MQKAPESLHDKMHRWVMVTLGWAVAVLLLVTAVPFAFDQSWRTAGGLLLMATAVWPRVRIPIRFRGATILAASIVLAVGVAIDGSGVSQQRQEEETAEETAMAGEREANRVMALREDFSTRRDELMSTLRAAIDAGTPLEALRAAAPFDEVADDEFMILFEVARAQRDAARERQRETDLLAAVRALPASDWVLNRDGYLQLMRLDSTNAMYGDRFRYYNDLIRQKSLEGARRVARFGPMPRKSALNGTYRDVTLYLRAAANDPGSIDVDSCTDVYYIDAGWLVGCDYRGANAFGGPIRASNWFIIRQGQVIRMEEASAYSPR